MPRRRSDRSERRAGSVVWPRWNASARSTPQKTRKVAQMLDRLLQIELKIRARVRAIAYRPAAAGGRSCRTTTMRRGRSRPGPPRARGCRASASRSGQQHRRERVADVSSARRIAARRRAPIVTENPSCSATRRGRHVPDRPEARGGSQLRAVVRATIGERSCAPRATSVRRGARELEMQQALCEMVRERAIRSARSACDAAAGRSRGSVSQKRRARRPRAVRSGWRIRRTSRRCRCRRPACSSRLGCRTAPPERPAAAAPPVPERQPSRACRRAIHSADSRGYRAGALLCEPRGELDDVGPASAIICSALARMSSSARPCVRRT